MISSKAQVNAGAKFPWGWKVESHWAEKWEYACMSRAREREREKTKKSCEGKRRDR